MGILYKSCILFTFLFLVNPIVSSTTETYEQNDAMNIVKIKIAQYPMLRSDSYPSLGNIFSSKSSEDESIQSSIISQFNYSWTINNTVYIFEERVLSIEELMGKGDKPLTVENYDLLYVGTNYWSYFRDGILFKKIGETIESFLSNGGGYIGSCAGTTFASSGFEKPNSLYQLISNLGVLKIVNVNMNQEWTGEMQYCIRSKTYLPSVNLKIEQTDDNPIFNGVQKSHINMTYGGGPGLYISDSSNPKLGEVIPLLTFDEELMETKPIHWYRKGILPGWKAYKEVKTDLKGNYAAVATTYDNSGKIVLFSTHAEIPMVYNATIEETFGLRSDYGSFAKLPRIIYEYNGIPLNTSYNWWMHRRAAAWVAGVNDSNLPPINELAVFMDKPIAGNYLYFNNSLYPIKTSDEELQEIVAEVDMTVIVGNITIEAYAENANMVEFYLDGTLEHIDNMAPYNWTLDKNNFEGVHRLEVRSYDEYNSMVRNGADFYFINSN